MNSPFIINDLPNSTWSVTWPRLGSIRDTGTKGRILAILFGELNYNEVGFGIALNNDETDIMWVYSDMWFSVHGDAYSQYLEDMYEIRGLVFRTEDGAKKMQDWLEKKYMWQILNA